MKKMMLAVLISAAAFAARADVITNTVVIVSNFYSQAFIETVVTQKVKSSHTDYWFTNHVNTITHDTLLVSQTNLSVNVDVGRDFVIAASNQANRAASAVNDSRTYANASAGSASSAASSASAASSSASSAAATRSAAASECASALATINARINWFDQHSGETITQVTTNINVYNPSYVIDKGSYSIDLNTMSVSVAGGKNVKLRVYVNWNSFGYPSVDNIGCKYVSCSDGLAVHYGDPGLDISTRKNICHLFIDDLYWSSDGYWYADVHWYHNTISGAYGKATYRSAGPAWPPNKHNPNSEFVEGQITLTKVSQEISSSTYNSYLGNNFYLWRDAGDASTAALCPVANYITDIDMAVATNDLAAAYRSDLGVLSGRIDGADDRIDGISGGLESVRTQVGALGGRVESVAASVGALSGVEIGVSTQLVGYASMEEEYPSGYFWYDVYRTSTGQKVGTVKIGKTSRSLSGLTYIDAETTVPGYSVKTSSPSGYQYSVIWNAGMTMLTIQLMPNGSGSQMIFKLNRAASDGSGVYDLPRSSAASSGVTGYTIRYVIGHDESRSFIGSVIEGNKMYSVGRDKTRSFIGNVVSSEMLNAFSNWVESVFQKR